MSTRPSFVLSIQADLESLCTAFICFINTVGQRYNSRYPLERNNKKDRDLPLYLSLSLSFFPWEGPAEPAQWTQWLAIIACSRHSLLPASCQFECPIAFTLEALAGVYKGPRYVSYARSFSYRRSLFSRNFSALSLSRARRESVTRDYFDASRSLLRSAFTVTDSVVPEIKIVGIRDF